MLYNKNMVNVVEVKTRKQRKQFVDFPTKLYSGNDYYVHPLRVDELALFSAKKNVNFDECDIVFYIAYKDRQVVGRICGIIQKVYNEKHKVKMVRFSRFDCIEDAIEWLITNVMHARDPEEVHRDRVMAHIMKAIRTSSKYCNFVWHRGEV